MKILISGAAGFLGYHLASKLSENASNQIICVDNGIRGENDKMYQDLLKLENVSGFNIDLNQAEALKQLPDEVDIIYHLAALNGTQNFYERPFDVLRCCTLPTLNLLEKYAPTSSLKRFIYAGTSESYASTVTRFNWPVPTAEDVPLGISDVFNPRWSYAAGKMHGEIATINGCKQYNKQFTIIRYHNAYGPRMGDKHVVPDFYSRARNGKLALFGYEDTRSFIYSDDAIRATILAGNSENTIGEVVNIGSDKEITIKDLGEVMKKVAGLTGDIELHPSPEGSVKRRCPDVAKLKKLTGFKENWSLEDGLRVTAEFYMNRDN
jgi:nucleoside-diphosphate-sugar epimerase